jgi:PadR family transcriptional regulator, regulatory protein PadR
MHANIARELRADHMTAWTEEVLDYSPPAAILFLMVAGSGSERSSQLLKGVLDMCLLAIISEEPSYGYEMVNKLAERGLDLVSEGTIYPVLSRLQKSALVEGYLVESSGGPARKYYRLTSQGATTLETWREGWQELSHGVDNVLRGAKGG